MPGFRGLDCVGGVRFHEDGVIDIHALLHSFVRGAREAGVHFALGTEARSFNSLGREVEVQTGSGSIQARCVVDAAGAWAGQVGEMAGSSEVALQPVRRHLFLTEAMDEVAPDSPFVWYLGQQEFYFRPEGRGLLLSGCDATPMEPCDPPARSDAGELLASKLTCRVARAQRCGNRPNLGLPEDFYG